MTTRVAIYCRVSTGQQTTENQFLELRRVATQRGWTIVREFAVTTSGAKDPPERRQLLDEAQRGNFDIVLVTAYDRLARSTVDLITVVEALRTSGVGFVSLRENVDTTGPTGRLIMTIFAGLAEWEREIIRGRVRLGLARARAEGKQLGRPRRRVDVTSVQRLLNEGRSWRQISMALKTPRRTLERAWSTSRRSAGAGRAA